MFSAGRPMSFWLTSLFPGPSNSAQHIESTEEIFAEGRNEWRSEWMNWEWIYMTGNLRPQQKLPLKGIQTAADNLVSLFRQQILLKFVMTVMRDLKQIKTRFSLWPWNTKATMCKLLQKGARGQGHGQEWQAMSTQSSSLNLQKPNPAKYHHEGFVPFYCTFTPTHVVIICSRFKHKSKKNTLNRVRKYNCFI